MPRRLRVASGGYACHVLDRAVGRARIFGKTRDYEAFEEVIAEAKRRLPLRVQWPQTEAELAALRRSVVRGAPFDQTPWQQRTAKRRGLQSALRPRGRPWKSPPAEPSTPI